MSGLAPIRTESVATVGQKPRSGRDAAWRSGYGARMRTPILLLLLSLLPACDDAATGRAVDAPGPAAAQAPTLTHQGAPSDGAPRPSMAAAR